MLAAIIGHRLYRSWHYAYRVCVLHKVADIFICDHGRGASPLIVVHQLSSLGRTPDKTMIAWDHGELDQPGDCVLPEQFQVCYYDNLDSQCSKVVHGDTVPACSEILKHDLSSAVHTSWLVGGEAVRPTCLLLYLSLSMWGREVVGSISLSHLLQIFPLASSPDYRRSGCL